MAEENISSELIIKYFTDQETYTKIYGPKTVVWIQLGKFYDAFSTTTEGIDLFNLSKILDIKLTRRKGKKSVGPPTRSNPSMLGFPTVTVLKYLDILVKYGHTVIIFDEKKTGKVDKHGKQEIDRFLMGIFSPGVHISDNLNNFERNYLLSVYIKEEPQITSSLTKIKQTGLLVVGLTLIDITTGTSIVHEFYSDKTDENFGLDELLRIIQSFNPKMTVIYYCPIVLDKKVIANMKIYLELDNITHHFYLNDPASNEISFLNPQIFKVPYQNNYLAEIFNLNKQVILNKGASALEILNIENKKYVVISFIIILRYLAENNEDLLKNLSYPEIYIYSKHLILGNNAIQQLNIIDSNGMGSFNRKIESLYDVVNKTETPMGKRLLKENLTNPLSQENKKVICERYDIIEQLLLNDLAKQIRLQLKDIHDMERFHRKMARGMISPYEFYRLDQFYQATCRILELISPNKIVSAMLDKSVKKDFIEYVASYDKIFCLDKMSADIKFSDLVESIFCKGVDLKIDSLTKQIKDGFAILNATKSTLSDMLPENKNSLEKISLEHNDMIGYYFTVTKTNEKLLKEELKDTDTLKIKMSKKSLQINKSDIEFKQTKTRTKIFITELKEYAENIETYKHKLSKQTEKKFITQILELYNGNNTLLQKITKFVSEIDFLVGGATVADLYFYCKPMILSKKSVPSYVRAKQIRHPIIERLSKETPYVPNDIELGNINSKNGIILYGLNSCGKTSLMKSIGLAVVLAQIGYYVPATEFEYEPYLALYARITGNDNLFKGLSSFMLEMTELGAIINRTENHKNVGENILVIGDEVCRGTNHIEAFSLVVASLVCLSEYKTSFIFSSHLHDIPTDPDILKLKNLSVFHLHVEYDTELDCLIFNRKMLPGIGPRSYALLVAKYVIRNDRFMCIATRVKKRLLENDDNNVTGMTTNDIPLKKSKYNKLLLLKMCTICGYRPLNDRHKDLESHHINFQSDCLSDGKIINHMHLTMNELYNLVILCRKCHERVHRGHITIRGYLDTSIGPLLDYEKDIYEIINEDINLIKSISSK